MSDSTAPSAEGERNKDVVQILTGVSHSQPQNKGGLENVYDGTGTADYHSGEHDKVLCTCVILLVARGVCALDLGESHILNKFYSHPILFS